MRDSREHILAASLQLFLRKSFKEVTMKEIVEATGLSKGAFYHYFSSKEQVFEEIISFFFRDFIREDFSQYSRQSLQAFYHDHLRAAERRVQEITAQASRQGDDSILNQYFLIFDAMKMIPQFLERQQAHQQNELASWTEMVRSAQEAGEITSSLPAEQVAGMFIYLGKGVGLSLLLKENMKVLLSELTAHFDGLYQLLKS